MPKELEKGQRDLAEIPKDFLLKDMHETFQNSHKVEHENKYLLNLQKVPTKDENSVVNSPVSKRYWSFQNLIQSQRT